jgi:hypothetical protein
MDGGLDLDFHGFTRLSMAQLAHRRELTYAAVFTNTRLLPAPDSIIVLSASTNRRQRLAARNRINIVQ